MASDYSYVKLCVTNLMINNSGGAEVALSCRLFYLNIWVGVLPKFFTFLIKDFVNLKLQLLCFYGVICLSSKACRMSKSMLSHSALLIWFYSTFYESGFLIHYK